MNRFRPTRQDQPTRDRYADVSLSPADFIAPYFVVEGTGIKKEIPSLKDVYHFSIDRLLEDVQKTIVLGIDKILLFGVLEDSLKDETGTAACQENNLVARAVADIKKKFPKLVIITDVCLCGYTTHGHCGLVRGHEILNDETLPLLAQMALTHAQAGADMVAPSSMMDGQVMAIRQALDNNGFPDTKIMSYSAKYASNFYGPFRDVVHSVPSFGDRKTYQMDYRTVQQAVEEVRADLDEGADGVMVKPAHAYLDIIQRINQYFTNHQSPITNHQLVAYHTSGEYMMIKAAAKQGLLNEDEAMREVLTAIKRAGAELIISYYAKEIAQNNDSQ